MENTIIELKWNEFKDTKPPTPYEDEEDCADYFEEDLGTYYFVMLDNGKICISLYYNPEYDYLDQYDFYFNGERITKNVIGWADMPDNFHENPLGQE